MRPILPLEDTEISGNYPARPSPYEPVEVEQGSSMIWYIAAAAIVIAIGILGYVYL